MPRDTISKATIWRREQAERKKVQAEKDNERKAKKIEELSDIGPENSPARESCPTREVKCIEFPQDYKSESTSHPLRRCELCCENKTDCVHELKDADGKCEHCHTYKMHCTEQPKITEYFPPKQCALCIVDVSRGENISRSCTFNDKKITHSEHEASLPLFAEIVPLLWGSFGLEKLTPAPVKCAENEASPFIPSPLENGVNIQCPLDSVEVQELFEAIHRFVDYTLDKLASENIIRDDCLPFSGSNIAPINDHDRNNRKSVPTVSLLLNASRTMNLSDIPHYFQSSSLEKLSMRTIFRALVSRYLLEAVFLRMPKDIEDLRACIQPHLQEYPEKIDDTVETHFCPQNNSTRFVDDSIRTGYGDICYFPDNFTFQEIGEDLIDVLLPRCLLGGKPGQGIVAACTSSCTKIAYLVSKLNLIVKARPRSRSHSIVLCEGMLFRRTMLVY